jgi:hypothetical protein
MQVGHKTAYSKGGSTTLRNAVCICYRCNKLQGTDSWNTFLRKMRKQPKTNEKKRVLKNMTIQKLKFLAKKYNVKVKGRTEEGFWENSRIPPSKTQYVNALAKHVSENYISSSLKEIPNKVKKKKKRSSSGLSWF